nr:RNA-directed DNA polymerase, eukaryota, reverse transcriptase zinc-binding domain protein [Tanacetum cinerariifolium]
MSPAPDPSTHDEPSVNNVHGSSWASATDVLCRSLLGVSLRKSASIWPLIDVLGLYDVPENTFEAFLLQRPVIIPASLLDCTNGSVSSEQDVPENTFEAFLLQRPVIIPASLLGTVQRKSLFLMHFLSVWNSGRDFSADLERNLLRLASFLLRLWTSLIVCGDGNCNTADVLSGHGLIPSGVEMLERTFSDKRFKMQCVRMDVTKLQEFCVSGHITSGCNSSFITLTPKYENMTLIKDFRPISLIDLQYKIISKLLADRQLFMVNEIVTWAKKHKKKIMMFKVDFEKAYDSLSWNYLDCMFDYMGFGDKWRMWIQGCLVSARSSVSSVLLNGSSTKEFHIHRGLRQGDPLSLFLFILSIEGLHILIEDAVQNSQFRGVFVESPPIYMSHLFYADDAIFMGEWDRNNVGSLIRLLNIFYLASGLKLILQKSNLYRIGVTDVNVYELARCTGCGADSLPSVYLGLHVGERMYRINSLRHLQKAGDKYSPVLYQSTGLSQKLEQSLLLGRREGIPNLVDCRTNAPKDRMPAEGTYSIESVQTLDTHRTPIQKQSKMLLCLVGISHRYYLGDELYLTFLYEDDRDMDMFNLIRAPNPTKVKTGSRPRAPHEVPLLTLTATHVIKMYEAAAAIDSSGVPSIIERSPLNFAHEAGASDQGAAAPEMPPSEDVPATVAPGAGQAEETAVTNPLAAPESWSSHGGKSLAAIQLGLASTVVVPEDAPAGVSDPDPLSFADAQSRQPVDVAQSSHDIAAAGDPESENTSSVAEVGSPESVNRPEWGVTNGNLLDTPEACQDLVDHVAPPGYFSKLRHMHNKEFLRQYNVNLARQVAMGLQLRLRFEQKAKLLRKSMAQMAYWDKRIQARELEIRNLEASLEAEANAKKTTEDRSAGLSQELENMCAQFSGLQVSNERLSQQVATLQKQVFREEKLKAAFEEFKRQQDERVEQRCHGLHFAVMKCDESLELRQAFADAVSAGITKGLSEGLRHGLEHGQAQLSLESIEAYDPKAEAKFIAALQALKDLKYLLDIHDLGPSSSQLTIPVYPEVRDPCNPWACKDEIVLADAIAATISRAEKKKKCRIVCRTYGVGSAHHTLSDGVPVSVPTVVPQGLALLLVDAATQTEFDT